MFSHFILHSSLDRAGDCKGMAVARDEVVQWVVMANAAVMLLCVAGPLCLCFIEEHWRSLMKASRFSTWPRLSGLTSIWVSLGGIYTLSAVVVLIHKRCQLKTLLVVTSITLVFSVVGLHGVISTGCPASSSVEAMATQEDAVANFNRGICVAWCHANRESPGLANVGSLCGEKPDSAFQSVMSEYVSSKVSTWCQQALLHDSFAADASYNGHEPFTTLTQELEVCVPTLPFAIMSVVVGFIVGFCLASELLLLESMAHKSRSKTAASGSKSKLKETLVPAGDAA